MVKLHKGVNNRISTGRAYLGQKKQAPVNMRKEEHQFVIDGYLIDEVLKQIPPTIKIIQASVAMIKRVSDSRIAVPNQLRKLGVSQMRHGGEKKTCFITFDATNKGVIQSNVKKVCQITDMPYGRAYFQYIVLANADGSCKFSHVMKEIRPDETDQRKKLRVLAATLGTGRVQQLFAELGAKKYRCVIREEAVKIIMCSKE